MSDIIKLITTRLKLDGEAEYNGKLKSISNNMGLLKSEMSKTTAEFAGQANSYKALTEKGEVLAKQLKEQENRQKITAAALKEAADAKNSFAEAVENARKALEAEKSASGDSSDKYKELSSELSKQEKLFSRASNTVNHWQKENNYAEASVSKHKHAIADNNKYLNEAENSVTKTASSINEFGRKATQTAKAINELNAEVKLTAKEVKDFGQKSFTAFDTLAGMLANDFIKGSVKQIGEVLKESAEAAIIFEHAMSTIAATTGASASEMDSISEAVRKTALETGVSINDLAKSARDLMEVNGDTGLAIAQLSSGTNLAIATNTDYSKTFDFLSAAMKTFNVEAEQSQNVTDSFAYTTVKTNTNLTQLGEAFTNVGGAAVNAGMSINEVNAYLVAFAEAGLKGGAAGTTLAGIITNLSTPTGKAVDMLDELKIKLYDANGASRDMFDIMADLEKALSKKTDEQRRHAESVIFDRNALKGWNTITREGVGAIKALSKEISASSTAFGGMGQAAGMAAKATDNAQGNINKMKAAVDELKISIGNELLPAIGKLSEMGANIALWSAEFIKNNEAIVPIITAVISALGVLAGATVSYTIAKKALIPAILAFNTALATNPIGLAIVALTTLTATVAAFALTAKDATSELDAFKSSLDAIADAQKNSENETLASASAAEKYADRLERLKNEYYDLNTETWKNTAAQHEYQKTVANLNDTVPNLNLEINTQTGIIKENRDEIYKSIAAWKELALTKVKATAAEEYRLAEAEAMYAVEKAEIDLRDAKAETKNATEAYSEAIERQTELSRQLAESQRTICDETGLVVDMSQVLQEEYNNLSNEVLELMFAMNDAAENERLHTEALEGKKEELELASEETSRYMELWEEFLDISDNAINANDDLGISLDGVADSATNASETIVNLQKEIKTLEDALYENINAGEISIDTMWKLIDAGHAAIIAFDEETGAIRLNEDATWALVDAKWAEVEVQLEVKIAAQAATTAQAQATAQAALAKVQAINTSGANASLAESYWKVYEAALAAAQAEGAALDGLQSALAGVHAARANRSAVISGGGSSRSSSGGGGSRTPSGGGSASRTATTPSNSSTEREVDPVAEDKKQYDEKRKEADYYYKMGKMTEEEYYNTLAKLRDEYLSNNTDAWRMANIELRKIEQDELKRREQLILSEFNERIRIRQEQIKKELDLEKQRLNTVIDGINQEIQARKLLKEDDDAEQRIKNAERALEAAKAQREFAREASDMAELDKLIAQRQQSLDDAINKHEEQLWLRGKQAEIAAAKDSISAAEQSAATRIENAAKEEQSAILAAVKSSAEQAAAALAISGFSQSLIDTLTGHTNITKTASINVNHMGSALTSGQITTAVIKALNLL